MAREPRLGHLADAGAVMHRDPAMRVLVEDYEIDAPARIEDVVVGVEVSHIVTIGVVDS